MLSQIYPFVSTFKHNGVESILDEVKPSSNKIEPSVFFDEVKCDPLLSTSYNQHIENVLVIAYLYTSGGLFLLS